MASFHAHKAFVVELLREKLYLCAIDHGTAAVALCNECMDDVETKVFASCGSKRTSRDMRMVKMLWGVLAPGDSTVALVLQPLVAPLIRDLKREVKALAEDADHVLHVPDDSFSGWRLPREATQAWDEGAQIGVQVGVVVASMLFLT
jgi:hypothetical protein